MLPAAVALGLCLMGAFIFMLWPRQQTQRPRQLKGEGDSVVELLKQFSQAQTFHIPWDRSFKLHGCPMRLQLTPDSLCVEADVSARVAREASWSVEHVKAQRFKTGREGCAQLATLTPAVRDILQEHKSEGLKPKRAYLEMHLQEGALRITAALESGHDASMLSSLSQIKPDSLDLLLRGMDAFLQDHLKTKRCDVVELVVRRAKSDEWLHDALKNVLFPVTHLDRLDESALLAVARSATGELRELAILWMEPVMWRELGELDAAEAGSLYEKHLGHVLSRERDILLQNHWIEQLQKHHGSRILLERRLPLPARLPYKHRLLKDGHTDLPALMDYMKQADTRESQVWLEELARQRVALEPAPLRELTTLYARASEPLLELMRHGSRDEVIELAMGLLRTNDRAKFLLGAAYLGEYGAKQELLALIQLLDANKLYLQREAREACEAIRMRLGPASVAMSGALSISGEPGALTMQQEQQEAGGLSMTEGPGKE